MTSKKKFFTGSSCNLSVKIGDFLKFATPPDLHPYRFFFLPPLTQKSLLTQRWYNNKDGQPDKNGIEKLVVHVNMLKTS